MKLRYTPQAIEDLREIRDYVGITLKNPAAADRIARRILEACERLTLFPCSGMSFEEKTGYVSDLRVLFLENYLAVYRVEAEYVSVARILDARQDYCALLFED